MNKGNIGLLIVILGVSVAAVFGSRNTDGVNASLAANGTVSIPTSKAQKAYKAYCSALIFGVVFALEETAGTELDVKALGVNDGCLESPNEEADVDQTTAQKADEKPEANPLNTYESALAEMTRAHQKKVAAGNSIRNEALRESRNAWLHAEYATLAPRARLATTPPPGISPTTRLGEWLSLAGLPFFIGLGLIVGGGVLARQAHRESLISSGPAAQSTSAPVDFGQLLDTLHSEVSALHLAAQSNESTAEDLLNTIETVQFEVLEPIIDSRGKVQARFGMAGFADIFSPLSGGERNLNRAWSAVVDQHLPEAQKAIQTAEQQINEARAALQRHL